jgi:hypothetical protein
MDRHYMTPLYLPNDHRTDTPPNHFTSFPSENVPLADTTIGWCPGTVTSDQLKHAGLENEQFFKPRTLLQLQLSFSLPATGHCKNEENLRISLRWLYSLVLT